MSVSNLGGLSPSQNALTPALTLSPQEQERYARHWMLPEVGPEGQQKLKGARVLVIGAGGLGCPLLAYLGAAGVGTLGIVDFDKVDVSNLQRQILHATSRVGWPKTASAATAVGEINPHVNVVQHPLAFQASNALEILRDYDVVADGTDNLPTRYLINDACALLRKPYVYGSILRFEGRVSVFWKGHGPCYRCLHPEPPPADVTPSCAEAGVLGVLPGIVGTLQAAEVLKLILGKGESLLGRLLVLDALRMKFKEIQLRADPNCPCCGPKASLQKLSDTQGGCSPCASVPEISVRELKQKIDSQENATILDVREAAEWEKGRLSGAVWIPLGQLKERLAELDREKPLYVHCKAGPRSVKAWKILQDAGFSRAQVVKGGIMAWREQIDPSVGVL